MHSPSPGTEPPGKACRPDLWRCTVRASGSYRACCKGAFGAGDDVSFFLQRGGYHKLLSLPFTRLCLSLQQTPQDVLV
jgi:hypothetical protein